MEIILYINYDSLNKKLTERNQMIAIRKFLEDNLKFDFINYTDNKVLNHFVARYKCEKDFNLLNFHNTLKKLGDVSYKIKFIDGQLDLYELESEDTSSENF